MLLSLQTSHLLATIILLVAAYAFSATFSELVPARLARRWGEALPEQDEWLSLNPLDHIDIIGVLLVAVVGFAWIRLIPLVRLINSRKNSSKLFMVLMAQGCTNLLIALVALTGLIITFGQESLSVAFSLYLTNYMPLTDFAEMYPQHSSLLLIVGLFLMALVVYNIYMATVSFIINGFRFFMHKATERGYVSAQEPSLSIYLATLFVLLIFAGPLRGLLLGVITHSSQLLSKLIAA